MTYTEWLAGGRVGAPPAPQMGRVARALPRGGPSASPRHNADPAGRGTGPGVAPRYVVRDGFWTREALPGEGGPGWALRATAR